MEDGFNLGFGVCPKSKDGDLKKSSMSLVLRTVG
jgi:hypothetical protein